MNERSPAMIGMKAKGLSLILKSIVMVSAVIGIVLSALAGAQNFMGGNRVLMYFTIQSNIVIALICAAGSVLLLQNREISDRWHTVKFVFTVSITLTGVVFCFVLAPTLGKYAWNAQNVLTHVVVPIAAVLDFFVTARYGSIRRRNVLYVTIPPLLYAIYAGIAYAARWEFSRGVHYPYFFLNWGSPAGAFGFTDTLPFMGCVWWIALILLFLLGVGFAYLRILNAMKKRIS